MDDRNHKIPDIASEKFKKKLSERRETDENTLEIKSIFESILVGYQNLDLFEYPIVSVKNLPTGVKHCRKYCGVKSFQFCTYEIRLPNKKILSSVDELFSKNKLKISRLASMRKSTLANEEMKKLSVESTLKQSQAADDANYVAGCSTKTIKVKKLSSRKVAAKKSEVPKSEGKKAQNKSANSVSKVIKNKNKNGNAPGTIKIIKLNRKKVKAVAKPLSKKVIKLSGKSTAKTVEPRKKQINSKLVTSVGNELCVVKESNASANKINVKNSKRRDTKVDKVANEKKNNKKGCKNNSKDEIKIEAGESSIVSNGQIVPYSKNTKRSTQSNSKGEFKMDAGESPTITNGEIVPFVKIIKKSKRSNSRNEIKMDVEGSSIVANGQIVPYAKNTKKSSKNNSKNEIRMDVDENPIVTNGQVVPYVNNTGKQLKKNNSQNRSNEVGGSKKKVNPPKKAKNPIDKKKQILTCKRGNKKNGIVKRKIRQPVDVQKRIECEIRRSALRSRPSDILIDKIELAELVRPRRSNVKRASACNTPDSASHRQDMTLVRLALCESEDQVPVKVEESFADNCEAIDEGNSITATDVPPSSNAAYSEIENEMTVTKIENSSVDLIVDGDQVTLESSNSVQFTFENSVSASAPSDEDITTEIFCQMVTNDREFPTNANDDPDILNNLEDMEEKETFLRVVDLHPSVKLKSYFMARHNTSETEKVNSTGTLKAVIKFHKPAGKVKGFRKMEMMPSVSLLKEEMDAPTIPLSHLNDVIPRSNEFVYRNSGGYAAHHTLETSNALDAFVDGSGQPMNRDYSNDLDSSDQIGKMGQNGAAKEKAPLVVPEKSSSFSIHPNRLCSDVCKYCLGKFGLLDTPCHVAMLKNVERQNWILSCEPNLRIDTCLCDACFRHVDKKANRAGRSKPRIFHPRESNKSEMRSCSVVDCEQLSLPRHYVKRQCLFNIRRKFPNMSLNFDKPGPRMQYPLCNLHFNLIERTRFSLCGLCKKKLQRNRNHTVGLDVHKLNKALTAENIPIKLSENVSLCKMCHYWTTLSLRYGKLSKMTLAQQQHYKNFVKAVRKRIEKEGGNANGLDSSMMNLKRSHSSPESSDENDFESSPPPQKKERLDSNIGFGNIANLLKPLEGECGEGRREGNNPTIQVKFGNLNIGTLSNLNIGQDSRTGGGTSSNAESDFPLTADFSFEKNANQNSNLEKCVTTMQFDKNTKKLWHDLQKPFGNQSSFVRHLILMESYWRSGDLVLSERANPSTKKYVNSVKSRVESLEGVADIDATCQPESDSKLQDRPNFTSTTHSTTINLKVDSSGDQFIPLDPKALLAKEAIKSSEKAKEKLSKDGGNYYRDVDSLSGAQRASSLRKNVKSAIADETVRKNAQSAGIVGQYAQDRNDSPVKPGENCAQNALKTPIETKIENQSTDRRSESACTQKSLVANETCNNAFAYKGQPGKLYNPSSNKPVEVHVITSDDSSDGEIQVIPNGIVGNPNNIRNDNYKNYSRHTIANFAPNTISNNMATNANYNRIYNNNSRNNATNNITSRSGISISLTKQSSVTVSNNSNSRSQNLVNTAIRNNSIAPKTNPVPPTAYFSKNFVERVKYSQTRPNVICKPGLLSRLIPMDQAQHTTVDMQKKTTFHVRVGGGEKNTPQNIPGLRAIAPKPLATFAARLPNNHAMSRPSNEFHSIRKHMPPLPPQSFNSPIVNRAMLNRSSGMPTIKKTSPIKANLPPANSRVSTPFYGATSNVNVRANSPINTTNTINSSMQFFLHPSLSVTARMVAKNADQQAFNRISDEINKGAMRPIRDYSL